MYASYGYPYPLLLILVTSIGYSTPSTSSSLGTVSGLLDALLEAVDIRSKTPHSTDRT